MDTYSNRASSLFTTFTTVLFVVATLNHLTSYFHSSSPVATIGVPRVSSIEYSEFKPFQADQVKFEFDLSVDLSTEYNWNVNQLYVFVVASYETTKNKKNEVVVFDKILRDVKDFKFKLSNAKNKYMLRDEFKGTLAGKKISLSVRYQVMPIFGLLKIINLPATGSFTVPGSYTVETATKAGNKR
jgi:signal peptidase complex subunit 3